MKMGNHADLAIVSIDLADPAQRDMIDAYVLSHEEGTAFHRPCWLAGVMAATGHAAHVLAAIGPSGRVRGVLPVHHIRSRLFGQAIVSSGFAVGGGILSDDSATTAALAGAIQHMARDRGGPSVELRGGASPGEGWTTRTDGHVGFVRPLAADDEAELLTVPRKHRAELRKALANPALHVRHGRDERLVKDHYRVYAQSVRNLGTPVFPARLFREMLERFGEQADITVVYDAGRPVSAVLSFYHRDHVLPYWGGGVQDARRLRSNELMYFRLMGHARQRGMGHFDFGRSKAGSGQAAWKKSFGFTPMPLAYHSWSPTGAVRDVNPQSVRYQRLVDMWKKLPLPVANLIGPLIARGLG